MNTIKVTAFHCEIFLFYYVTCTCLVFVRGSTYFRRTKQVAVKKAQPPSSSTHDSPVSSPSQVPATPPSQTIQQTPHSSRLLQSDTLQSQPLAPQSQARAPHSQSLAPLSQARAPQSESMAPRSLSVVPPSQSLAPPSQAWASQSESVAQQSLPQTPLPQAQIVPQDDDVTLVDQAGRRIRVRGRTICADLQSMRNDMRIDIKVNIVGQPNNFPEADILGSYLGVIVKDPVLAPINFTDLRNQGLEPFKKKIILEIESKFRIEPAARNWLLRNVGLKWRNWKSFLKGQHWDTQRPASEIREAVPEGVDELQWSQLVGFWDSPEDQARAAKNSENVKKQTTHHTLGRVSALRKMKEEATEDRLLLWKSSRKRKNGSWSSQDCENIWAAACALLQEQGLTPEDGDAEANERAFKAIMGPEHPGRVRTKGFGATSTKLFHGSIGTPGQSSSSAPATDPTLKSVQEDMERMKAEMEEMKRKNLRMEEFIRKHSSWDSSNAGSDVGDNENP